MRIIDPFLQELEQEAKTTRKFLDAMPADKSDWRPHPKSMTAGQLAMHIATLPGNFSESLLADEFNMAGGNTKPEAPSKESILAAFEENLKKTRVNLASLDDTKVLGLWTFKVEGKTAMTMPRVAMVRGFIYNHLYHHRGQFGVYLRLMGANVPASYGPSADENPLAELLKAHA